MYGIVWNREWESKCQEGCHDVDLDVTAAIILSDAAPACYNNSMAAFLGFIDFFVCQESEWEIMQTNISPMLSCILQGNILLWQNPYLWKQICMIYEHQTLDQSDDADMMNHSFLESNNYHFDF